MKPPKSRDEQARYPIDHSFVVQFQAPSADGSRPGRVEHLASGHAGRFGNGQELLDFVDGILAEVEAGMQRNGGSRSEEPRAR